MILVTYPYSECMIAYYQQCGSEIYAKSYDVELRKQGQNLVECQSVIAIGWGWWFRWRQHLLV